jgi:class 3 adenylate cyclase
MTFLSTDIEGSTGSWEGHPDAMGVALARHDELLGAAVDAHGGVEFATGVEADADPALGGVVWAAKR